MTPCPGNLLPPPVHYPERMASDLGDNRLRNRNDERPKTPGRAGAIPQRSRWPMNPVTGANAATGGLTASRSGPAERKRPVYQIDPENGVGRLTQGRYKSTTSVDARVPGSGCAETAAKPGHNPPAPASKREPRRPRVDYCQRGWNRGRCRLGAEWTDFFAANPRIGSAV